MRPLYKKIVDPPVTNSTYIKLIKQCCIMFPDKKEYIGKCIKCFKDEAKILKEEKNFKVTIKDDDDKLLVCLKVTGGLKGLTRTKYYVNRQGIYRYDWRKRAWECIKIIAIGLFAIAYVGVKIVLPFMGALDMDFHEMIDNDYNSGINDHDIDNYDFDDSQSEDLYHQDILENHDSVNEFGNDSESASDIVEDFIEDYEADESLDDDEEEEEIKANSNANYYICAYWKEPRYLMEKYGCCEQWNCCIYCHMDNIKHKIDLSRNSEKYCMRCENFFPYTENKCTSCQYNHSNVQNNRNIADRCRFLKNASYIPVKFCCYNAICCHRCHDEHFNHTSGCNLRYICCHCNRPTRIDSKYCDNCKNSLMTGSSNYERIYQLCPNFSEFYYLLNFRCCPIVYCCSKCHNKLENHKCDHTYLKVCTSCYYENNTVDSEFICKGCFMYLYPAKSN